MLLFLDLLGDDVVAQADALVADVDGRPSDELLDLLLILSAEGAAEIAARLVATLAGLHGYFFASSFFFVRTSSMSP